MNTGALWSFFLQSGSLILLSRKLGNVTVPKHEVLTQTTYLTPSSLSASPEHSPSLPTCLLTSSPVEKQTSGLSLNKATVCSHTLTNWTFSSIQLSFIYILSNLNSSRPQCTRLYRKTNKQSKQHPMSTHLVTVEKKNVLLTGRNHLQKQAQRGADIGCKWLGVKGGRWNKRRTVARD